MPDMIESFSESWTKNVQRLLLVGPHVAGATPYVGRACVYNALKALLCRAFRRPKHEPQKEAWEVLGRFSEDIMRVGDWSIQFDELIDWINDSPPRQKRAYFKALPTFLSIVWSSDWTMFTAFPKTEKLFCSEQHDSYLALCETIVDRLINGPHIMTHLIAGRLLRPASRQLKDIWNYQCWIFYAAVSSEVLNKWFNENYVIGMFALMCDYSMYDSCHSDLSWDWIESCYRRWGLYDEDCRFASVMKAWRQPRGRINGQGWSIAYEAYTMNASGRDDTALANAMINGNVMFLSLLHAYFQVPLTELTIEHVHWGQQNLRISVCGDDSLVLLPITPDDVNCFQERTSFAISQFGFDAGAQKMKVSDNPFDFVYLGMRPYPADRWYFAKTIGRAIWKLGWRVDPQSGDQEAWMAGVMQQNSLTQRIVPILSDLSHHYMAYHGSRKITPVVTDVHRPWTVMEHTPDYTQQVILYIAEGYGLHVNEIHSAINYVRGIPVYPFVLDHPAITQICTKDEM
jgi:hypothetical protein